MVSLVILLLCMANSDRARALPSPQMPAPWDDPVLRGKVHPALLKQIIQGQAGQVPIVVEMKAQADLAQAIGVSASRGAPAGALVVESLRSTADISQREARAFLAAEEVSGRAGDVKSLWIINAISAHASPETIWQLAARPDVSFVRADRRLQWLDPNLDSPTSDLQLPTSDVEWGISKIQADQVWAAFNISGTGIVVANMDTGVDWLHPALSSNYRGCIKSVCQHETSWFDATPTGALYPLDGHGHGTHTMGTIAGRGGIGVAPGAQWIAARVLDSAGSGYDSWIHAGFQWILAPGGDPAMAPRVVNNSWGTDLGSDITFQDDVRALRAAGILPIFSNGNNGPKPGTVGSPAALPDAFAVGATDDTDMVAIFSSRGPSPWGEIRPHIVAPGVRVLSARPGGTYAYLSGTSMAAPHVTGAAALMLSADPGLTITATMYALTTTAAPLTTTLPNNDSGWGRLDAYAAMLAVSNVTTLSGTVKRADTLAPIPGAVVALSGAQQVSTQTDANGDYLVGAAAGVYNVSTSAFGFETNHAYNVVLSKAAPATRDWLLTPLPSGSVRGALTDLAAGLPITATVSVLDTPVAQTAFGAYSLTLPVGTYTLRATQSGYRVLTTTVAITLGSTSLQDLALTRGPKILLVDSGAWYSENQIGYYGQSLDALGYAYDTWTIRHPPDDTPRAKDLLSYDVVIWSSPLDSPGYVGANSAITTLLASKRSLLVSGQDVALWDGGGTGTFYASYLHDYFKTLYVQDDAGFRELTGLEGDILAGLTLTITGPGGADNQSFPDEITVSDPDYASQILAYPSSGSGGQKIGLCLPYRGAMLSFGYEAINDRITRQEVMRRAMDYFASPRQSASLSFGSGGATIVGRPGDTVTHTVRLRNVSEVATDTVTLTIDGGLWPHVLSPTKVVVGSCNSVMVTLVVTVPNGVGWNASDTLTLTARSSLSSSVAAAVILTAKTPAPILLVDDGRWYDVASSYTRSLDQSGVAFDVWRVPRSGMLGTLTGPPAERMGWYPVVVWFTGYDWYDPLNSTDEESLTAYLRSGGRLFLSSPFYLDMTGLTTFAQTSLGILTFTDRLTTSVAYGAASSPIGDGLGSFVLTNPYPSAGFFTLAEAIVPGRDTATALRGSSDRALAIHRAEAGSRTAFMITPFEALNEENAARAMKRIVGWLGWLGDSTLSASRDVAQAGDSVAYTLTARHNGAAPIHVTVTATLPLSVTLVPGSLTPGAGFDPASGRVTWAGMLDPGAAVTVSYQVTLDASLLTGTCVLPGMPLTTTAIFHDDTHGIAFDPSAVVRVSAPSLALNAFTAPSSVKPGEPLTYTLIVSNSGLTPAAFARVTLLPPLDARVTASAISWSGPGLVTGTGGAIDWRGPLDVGQFLTLTFKMGAPAALSNTSLLGEALLWDGAGGAWERSVWVDVEPYRFYLTVVFR